MSFLTLNSPSDLLTPPSGPFRHQMKNLSTFLDTHVIDEDSMRCFFNESIYISNRKEFSSTKGSESYKQGFSSWYYRQKRRAKSCGPLMESQAQVFARLGNIA